MARDDYTKRNWDFWNNKKRKAEQEEYNKSIKGRLQKIKEWSSDNPLEAGLLGTAGVLGTIGAIRYGGAGLKKIRKSGTIGNKLDDFIQGAAEQIGKDNTWRKNLIKKTKGLDTTINEDIVVDANNNIVKQIKTTIEETATGKKTTQAILKNIEPPPKSLPNAETTRKIKDGIEIETTTRKPIINEDGSYTVVREINQITPPKKAEPVINRTEEIVYSKEGKPVKREIKKIDDDGNERVVQIDEYDLKAKKEKSENQPKVEPESTKIPESINADNYNSLDDFEKSSEYQELLKKARNERDRESFKKIVQIRKAIEDRTKPKTYNDPNLKPRLDRYVSMWKKARQRGNMSPEDLAEVKRRLKNKIAQEILKNKNTANKRQLKPTFIKPTEKSLGKTKRRFKEQTIKPASWNNKDNILRNKLKELGIDDSPNFNINNDMTIFKTNLLLSDFKRGKDKKKRAKRNTQLNLNKPIEEMSDEEYKRYVMERRLSMKQAEIPTKMFREVVAPTASLVREIRGVPRALLYAKELKGIPTRKRESDPLTTATKIKRLLG